MLHTARSYQQLLGRLLRHNAIPQLRKVLDKTLPADLSPVLPLLLEQDRQRILGLLIESGKAAAVLLGIDEPELHAILDETSDATIAAICSSSAPDDAADLLDLLDAERRTQILDRLGASRGGKLEALLLHGKKETAGSLMTTDFLALNESLTVAEAIEVIRAYPRKDSFFYAYTVDDENQLKGVLSLRTLLLSSPDSKLIDVMLTNVIRSSVEAPEEDVAQLVSKYDLLSIPVIDSQNRLIGVVTVDDVIDVIQEQAEEDLLHLSGVAVSARISGSARSAFRSRFPWLVVNLFTALIAASVVRYFEGTIERWAILAAFMPVVAGMGGNAGTQTLTVFVRGLALGHLEWKSGLRAVWKEMIVGLMNGTANGLLTGGVVWVWTRDLKLALVIVVAMICNMFVAGTSGALVPLALKRLNFDPAVSSSVFVTTFTDVAGFFVFLGLATLVIRFWTL
jgi:magnesium transporter